MDASWLLQDGGGKGKTSAFHGRGPIATHPWPSSLLRSSVVWVTVMVGKAPVCPQMVILEEALYAGKASLYRNTYASKNKMLPLP